MHTSAAASILCAAVIVFDSSGFDIVYEVALPACKPAVTLLQAVPSIAVPLSRSTVLPGGVVLVVSCWLRSLDSSILARLCMGRHVDTAQAVHKLHLSYVRVVDGLAHTVITMSARSVAGNQHSSRRSVNWWLLYVSASVVSQRSAPCGRAAASELCRAVRHAVHSEQSSSCGVA